MRRFEAYDAAGARLFELAGDPEAADVAVLPVHWNRYITSGYREVGLAFAQRMRRAGKRLLVFFDSDSEEPMPFEDAIVFRPSLHRSRRPADELPLPAWSGDLIEVLLGGTLALRTLGEKPVIGFCGAVHRQPPTLLGGLREAWLDRRGRAPDRSAEEAAFDLRRAVLERLDASAGLQTNFIRRRGYFGGSMSRPRWRRRAGSAWDPLAGARARAEYLQNVIDSDYVVCVRGGGNFSLRLYETLCCGRIPIVIDTDCVLPFAEWIDWRSHAVFCDASGLESLPETVEAFHRALVPERFLALQREARRLWLEWLSPLGFFSHLATQIGSARIA